MTKAEVAITFEFEFDGTEDDFLKQLKKTMLATIEEMGLEQ